MLLRLVTLFAILCSLAGVLLGVVGDEPELALVLGGGGAVVVLGAALHRFAVDQARLPKSQRRVLNLHAD
jgi:hypothetical protein